MSLATQPHHPTDWLTELLGAEPPPEGRSVTAHGHRVTMLGGILRTDAHISEAQGQTRDSFGFQWSKRDTFEGNTVGFSRRWLIDRYGDVPQAAWLKEHGERPLILDAGCGAALSALALFEPILDRTRYLGVDVSTAVEVARDRFREKGLPAHFIQSDLQHLPLPEACADIVFSEGVLHHTDNTHAALSAVTRHLKPGGRILFYVYAKKGPIREFTDDLIRDRLQGMTPEEAWEAMIPLTKLGEALGRLDTVVDVPEDIEFIDVPAGPITIQRLLYWHVFKAFYDPDMTLDEMNHINFDWYAPKNAHRHTPEEVRLWCNELRLEIEREKIEPAGITIVARRTA